MKKEERKPCPNLEINKEQCPCTVLDCPRRGFCCKCIATHRSKDSKVACMR